VPTARLVVALKPCMTPRRSSGLLATYQSVSGAGKREWTVVRRSATSVGDSDEPRHFTKQIAFNVARIDSFLDDGSTRKSGRWW
jgi:aspartate-semialdehyde dehydrogenase